MSNFVPNPTFNSDLRRAVTKALDQVGSDLQREARKEASWSTSIPPNVVKEPVRSDANGASVAIVLRPAGFKGHFFEKGTKPRRTRKGASRGVGPKRPFMAPARDRVVARGLPLHRFL